MLKLSDNLGDNQNEKNIYKTIDLYIKESVDIDFTDIILRLCDIYGLEYDYKRIYSIYMINYLCDIGDIDKIIKYFEKNRDYIIKINGYRCNKTHVLHNFMNVPLFRLLKNVIIYLGDIKIGNFLAKWIIKNNNDREDCSVLLSDTINTLEWNMISQKENFNIFNSKRNIGIVCDWICDLSLNDTEITNYDLYSKNLPRLYKTIIVRSGINTKRGLIKKPDITSEDNMDKMNRRINILNKWEVIIKKSENLCYYKLLNIKKNGYFFDSLCEDVIESELKDDFRFVIDAYEILSNKILRERYDNNRRYVPREIVFKMLEKPLNMDIVSIIRKHAIAKRYELG